MATRKAPPPDPLQAAQPGCVACKFYKAEKEAAGEPWGYCRRFPPSAHIEDGDLINLWPTVDAAEWCGEFKGAQ